MTFNPIVMAGSSLLLSLGFANAAVAQTIDADCPAAVRFHFNQPAAEPDNKFYWSKRSSEAEAITDAALASNAEAYQMDASIPGDNAGLWGVLYKDGMPAPALRVHCDEDQVFVFRNNVPGFYYEFQDAYKTSATTPYQRKRNDRRLLTESEFDAVMPLYPQPVAQADRQASPIALTNRIGVTTTGLPIYGPTAATDGIMFEDPVNHGFTDACGGHTDFNGVYHLHALPDDAAIQASPYRCMQDADIWDEPGQIVGYAGDGLPIVTPYYYDAGSNTVVGATSSWQDLRAKHGMADDERYEDASTPQAYRDDVDSSFDSPLTFGQYLSSPVGNPEDAFGNALDPNDGSAWVKLPNAAFVANDYQAGHGNLDVCNARQLQHISDALHPQYTQFSHLLNYDYAYFATRDSFPYMTACLWGDGQLYDANGHSSNQQASAAASYNTNLGGAAAGEQPNILFITADDLDPGVLPSACYPNHGADKANMPNLASLCQNGVTFDRSYSQPACTPSRASLASGVHPHMHGVEDTSGALALDQPTFFKYLTAAGYDNAVVGKWDLAGAQDEANPAAHGVQSYAGLILGSINENKLDSNGNPNGYENWQITHGNWAWIDGTEDGVEESQQHYTTSKFTDLAIDWLHKHDDLDFVNPSVSSRPSGTHSGRTDNSTPWFMWLSYNAPHTPFHMPPATLYSTQPANINRPTTFEKYRAMVEAMDSELGRLLDSLSAADRARTVVVFVGDNGAERQVNQAPYSGQAKTTVYEGGIQVPMVVAGYGVSRVGERESALVGFTDFFQSFLSMAQYQAPAQPQSFEPTTDLTESMDFSPLFSTASEHLPSDQSRDFVYATYGTGSQRDWAVIDRQGYKLLAAYSPRRGKTLQRFFRVYNDQTQQMDLNRNGLLERQELDVNNLSADEQTAYDALVAEQQRIQALP